MIKVPGTDAGLPAIEHLIGEGLNINITLLFSLDNYVRVSDAYISGLERFSSRGGALSDLASVASFFVSRIDTMIDDIIGKRHSDGGTAAHCAAHYSVARTLSAKAPAVWGLCSAHYTRATPDFARRSQSVP